MKNEQTAIIIKDLCKLKGISISNLLLECDIRKSLIYDMEKRDCAPSAEILEKIADYFECSVDYLLGRTDIMEINNTNTKLLKNDWKKIFSAFATMYQCKDKYKDLMEKTYPTYEELKKFADGCAVNVDFFYCNGEKRVNSDSNLTIKSTDWVTKASAAPYNALIKKYKALLSSKELTDKTTAYQCLHHFVYKTYGYNSDVVEDIFTKNIFINEMHIENLFFKFLENYFESNNSKKTSSNTILNAAHSGDEFNTKPFTPEQEAYIDKLIEKKKNE